MLAVVKQQLLFIQKDVEENFSLYRKFLQDEVFKRDGYKDLVYSLLVIPNLKNQKNLEWSREIASLLGTTIVSQDVHNALEEIGEKEHYQRPILIGDFGMSLALEKLFINNGHSWLYAFCSAHCVVNEMGAIKSNWRKRGFVPEDEKRDVLQKEYGEFPAFAANVASDIAGIDEVDKKSFAGFAYYAGELTGRVREDFNTNWEATADLARTHLALISDKTLRDALELNILMPILEQFKDKKINVASQKTSLTHA